MTYTRQPSRATAYEAADHRQPLAERSYRTNIQRRSTASFDALTGQVVYLQRTRITIRVLRSFCHEVCAANPQAGLVYLVQDNWSVHAYPDVLVALQLQTFPRPIHTPPNWPTTPRLARLDLPIPLLQLVTYTS